jgi:hypothetical protein
MPKSSDSNKTVHIITKRMIAAGKAPNYRKIAAELGVPPAEGQKAVAVEVRDCKIGSENQKRADRPCFRSLWKMGEQGGGVLLKSA